MIGMLNTTHGNLGSELIKAAESIRGSLKGVMHISVDQKKGVEELKKEISTAIKKLDQGRGVLILTDLFGGTPSNISLSFLKEGIQYSTPPGSFDGLQLPGIESKSLIGGLTS